MIHKFSMQEKEELLGTPAKLMPTSREAFGQVAIGSIETPDLLPGEFRIFTTLDCSEARRGAVSKVIDCGSSRPVAFGANGAGGS